MNIWQAMTIGGLLCAFAAVGYGHIKSPRVIIMAFILVPLLVSVVLLMVMGVLLSPWAFLLLILLLIGCNVGSAVGYLIGMAVKGRD